MELDKIYADLKELEQPIERVSQGKVQIFGNEFINVYFFRSGFDFPDGRAYYVIVENGDNPIPPNLMTPNEIQEKLGLTIDDYY